MAQPGLGFGILGLLPQQHFDHIPRVGSYNYIWADVTLEEYSVNQCSQYSDGTMHFTEMELTAANGEVLTPRWTQPAATECQGKLVIHDSKTIDISHNGGDGLTVV